MSTVPGVFSIVEYPPSEIKINSPDPGTSAVIQAVFQGGHTIPAFTERAVLKQLALVCEYLGFQSISTHNWYATENNIIQE